MRLPKGPLQSRNFQLLAACNVMSMAGNSVANVAIPFAVLSIGGSASDVGYVATANLLPLTVFLLLGGVIADRLPRHKVIVTTDLLQALAQAISAVLVLTGKAAVWELIVAAAVRGTGLGFYMPAANGLLPQTVAADHLAQANAINRVGQNSAEIGGSGLGGVLVGLAGPGWGLAVDAASFALAAALRLGMRFPALPPPAGRRMLHELREGWREFSSRRWLWTMVAQFSCVLAISAGTVSVLGPIVASTHLGGARSWGFIVAANSTGAVLGGLAMIRFRSQRTLLAANLSIPAFSLVLFALAVPLSVPLIMVAGLLAGGCLEVFSVNWAITMQQEIPRTVLSRVSAYDALGSFALTPVGAVVAGPLAIAFGVRGVLAAAGVVVILLTVAVLFVPEVRHMRRRPTPGPDPDPADTLAL
jgi:MFS family permease